MAYGIPSGNPTVVWDTGSGGVTNNPYVSWQYHLDRSGGARGGVDMKASPNTPIYSPVAGTVSHASDAGAGNILRITAPDGWIEVFEHLNSYATAAGVTVGVGALVGYSGTSGGVPAHLHWHREKPLGTRHNPWDYFNNAPTPTPEEDTMKPIFYSYQGTTTTLANGFVLENAALFIRETPAAPLRWIAMAAVIEHFAIYDINFNSPLLKAKDAAWFSAAFANDALLISKTAAAHA